MQCAEARLDRAETAEFGTRLETVEKAQTSGDLPHGDPYRLARTLWAGMHGIADLAVQGQILTPDVRPVARLGFRASLDGLAAQ